MEGEENKPKRSLRKKRAKKEKKKYKFESVHLLNFRLVEAFLLIIYEFEKEFIKKTMSVVKKRHRFGQVCATILLVAVVCVPAVQAMILTAQNNSGGQNQVVQPAEPVIPDPPMPPPYFNDAALESIPYDSIFKYNENNTLNLINLNKLQDVDTCFLYKILETKEDAYLEENLEFIDYDLGAWDFITLYAIPSDKNFSVFKDYENLAKELSVKDFTCRYTTIQTTDELFPVMYQAAFTYDGVRYFMDIKTSMPEEMGNRLEYYLNVLIPD